ncbi:MAG: SDR family NAD(P)-dependent oxidoreductase, partial [Deltaproteobacteria bacterium]|nr:SDR family NAD(P)-dependent oxidoreductase [Deltaproteobacteria bacterium]
MGKDELRFDDKVVIVTGAGAGLGRTHALLFGSRGAKVVVNDLGGGMHGGGAGSAAADGVVAEIKEAGGEAVANYDSVEDGDKIVQTAMDSYGTVDVVVNNAGILRDTSFHKMKEADWDLIYRVHVLGAFKVTHAAWPIMREKGYGRVIMTASAAGIYGNFGQANYAMAKLGLTGMANTLALEGGRKGVHVNTVAPIAGSRLTETVLPPELIAALKPEYVSPLIAWLCHEECEETGGLFEVGGGYFGKLRWDRSVGAMVRVGKPITTEWVKRSWDKICSFEESTQPANIAESMGALMENIQAGPTKGGNELIDVDEALGFEYPEQTSSYDERDLAIYALGVGAASDPMNDKDLQLVYEMHADGFMALPTYGVIPAVNSLMGLAKQGITADGCNYGLDRLLHGEQYTEVLRPLPKSAKLTHRARIKDIWDKGKGAIVNTETKSYDENGDLLVVNELVAFIRGAGGWGGDSGPSSKVNTPPDREPDQVTEEQISENQALLYRLSGDWNPLHVDPSFAQAFGYEKPILHGLCAYGYASRHVINAFSKGDPRYFKSIKVRFAKTVLPGDTLVTEMWKESDTRIVFRCRVKERDEDVITHAALELYEEIPKPKPKAAPKPAAATAAAPTEPISADIFTAINGYLKANPDQANQIAKVFQFKLSGPDSLWTVDVKNDGGSVAEGAAPKPDCTLEMTDGDFMDMCTGKADAQKLYFGGKLKIAGDIMASQKLTFLKKLDRQLVIDAMQARGGGGGAAAPATAPAEPASGDVFLGIKAYVGEHSELVGEIGTVYQFKLTDPDSVWTVNLKDGDGAVEPGETTKPDCTLTITTADFMDMTSGKADAQKLYFGGKLKISGNIMASQKLTFLQKIDPEWAKEQIAKLKAEGVSTAGAAVATTESTRPQAPAIMAALEKRLADEPKLLKEVQAVIQLNVTDPDGAWTLTVKGDQGKVDKGTIEGPDATPTLVSCF